MAIFIIYDSDFLNTMSCCHFIFFFSDDSSKHFVLFFHFLSIMLSTCRPFHFYFLFFIFFLGMSGVAL